MENQFLFEAIKISMLLQFYFGKIVMYTERQSTTRSYCKRVVLSGKLRDDNIMPYNKE